MAMADHLRPQILIDNALLITLTDLEVNGVSGAQAVETLLGLTGKTPGAKRLNISATATVPLGGPEFDAASAVANGTFHEVQVPQGSKTIVSQGWIDEFAFKGSVGNNATYDFKYTGDFPAPE